MVHSGPSPTSLSALAPELLVQIFSACCWEDILTLRQESLQSLVFEEFMLIPSPDIKGSAPNIKGARDMERPLSLYAANELERLFLQWMKAAKGWGKKTLTAPREILLKVDEQHMPQDPYCLRLVPGGRWLLVFDQTTGGIFSYDLDNPNPTSTRTALIPPRFEDGFEEFCISNVATDPGAPFLAFHVCVLYCLDFQTTRWTAEIWHFETVWDENGCAGTSLSAKLMVTFFFMHMPDGFVSSPSLNGSSVLFELTESDVEEPRSAVIVVNWTQVANRSHDFERQSLLTFEKYLLASSHLLLVEGAENDLSVVDLRNFHTHRDNVGFSEFYSLHDYPTSCIVCGGANFSLGPTHIKPSISINASKNTARILTTSEDGETVAMEVSLERTEDRKFASAQILDDEDDEVRHHVDLIGYRHTFSACDTHIHLTTVIWPEDLSVGPIRIDVQRPVTRPYATPLAMDEGTGRVILYYTSDGSVTVMDISA